MYTCTVNFVHILHTLHILHIVCTALILVMFCPCTFLSIVCPCTFLSLLASYTCTVNWFCVHLYGKLVMYTLVVLCTVVQKLILWYLYSKLAFLVMKATLEVQKAVFLSVCVYVGTHFAQSWHSDWTKFACWLHKVCTNFAIHQQLVSIKIKFKLSSSQEPSQCLLGWIL